MDDRDLARQLALGRIGLGVVLGAVPSLLAAPWLGRSSARDGRVRVVLRALAVRDLAIGVGLKRALDSGAPARDWVAGGLAADATDMVATVLAGDDLPLFGRVTVGALAGASVAIGAKLLTSGTLDGESGPVAAAAPPAAQDAARERAASLTSPA